MKTKSRVSAEADGLRTLANVMLGLGGLGAVGIVMVAMTSPLPTNYQLGAFFVAAMAGYAGYVWSAALGGLATLLEISAESLPDDEE